MYFIQARNYTRVAGRDIRLVVLHTMEAPEKPGTARAVAKWFAGNLAPQASAHYCIDNREVIQCVKEQDVAWGAPSANRTGVHIEHAGYANQTPDNWHDDYSNAVLDKSAKLCAEICLRYAIPLARLSPDEVRAGKAGICDHWTITQAFKTPGGHRDCGASFPWDEYVAKVRTYAGVLDVTP